MFHVEHHDLFFTQDWREDLCSSSLTILIGRAEVIELTIGLGVPCGLVELDMRRLKAGERRCPHHHDVKIQFEVYGKKRERQTDKAIMLTWAKEGYGKIECAAMSEEGNCLKDSRPCSVEEILRKLLTLPYSLKNT